MANKPATTADGQKWCIPCEGYHPVEDFYTVGGKPHGACKAAKRQRVKETARRKREGIAPTLSRRNNKAVPDLRHIAKQVITDKLGFYPVGCESIHPYTLEVTHCPLYAECRVLVAAWRDVRCCLSDVEVAQLEAASAAKVAG
jgi:hypothetical protein